MYKKSRICGIFFILFLERSVYQSLRPLRPELRIVTRRRPE